MVTGDGEYVADLPFLKGDAQVRAGSVDLVAGYPGCGDADVQRAVIIRTARAGFVAKARLSGIPAARQRAMSSVHERGTYSSRSIAACPSGIE